MKKSSKSICLLMLVVIACCAGLSGCGTIIYGAHQKLDLSTTPQGSAVRVGTQSCVTPCTLTVSRKEKEVFVMEGPSERAFPILTSAHLFTSIMGNLPFLVIPGLIVDVNSGGYHALQPVNVVLSDPGRRN